MSAEPSKQKPTPRVEEDPTYFELQSFTGATKHLGSLRTTKELVELCGIDGRSHVLEVGCGVAATASYMAKQIGCRILGVDIRPDMIERAKVRAKREQVVDATEFQVSDATDLPFEESSFDVVMAEPVTTFIEDKAAAIDECARVLKHRGCLGLNEEIWRQTPVPPDIVEYVAFAWDVQPEILNLEGWVQLLKASGLAVELASPRRYGPLTDLSEVARYGCGDSLTMLRRTMKLYFTSAAFRKYMRDRRRLPKGIWDYLGYALLVGRK